MLAALRSSYDNIRTERARIEHIYVTTFDTDLYYPVDFDDPVSRYHPKSLPPASSLPALRELIDPQRVSPPPAQRSLAKVAHHAQWLLCLEGAQARDAAPTPLTAVRNREAARIVATSMPSSGAWLDIVPDNTAANEFKSVEFEVAMQRRLGLYLAHAEPTVRALREAAHLKIDFFGDFTANGGEHNKRHNAVNRAATEALGAVAIGPVILGDKGSPEATVHLNSSHVIDIAELGGDEETPAATASTRRSVSAPSPSPSPQATVRLPRAVPPPRWATALPSATPLSSTAAWSLGAANAARIPKGPSTTPPERGGCRPAQGNTPMPSPRKQRYASCSSNLSAAYTSPPRSSSTRSPSAPLAPRPLTAPDMAVPRLAPAPSCSTTPSDSPALLS